mgnify:CR=1 FL=1
MQKITVSILCIVLFGCSPTVENGASPALDGHTNDPAIDPSTVRELLDHLIGDWQDTGASDGTIFEEHWSRTNDSLLTGRGLVLSGRDTVFVEYLGIHRNGDRAFYSAMIPSQNDGASVDFKLTSANGDSLVFEEPEHDFPQRITYVWSATEQGWYVRVAGQGKNGAREERLHFRSSGADPS